MYWSTNVRVEHCQSLRIAGRKKWRKIDRLSERRVKIDRLSERRVKIIIPEFE